MNGSSLATPIVSWIGVDVAKRSFDAAVWSPGAEDDRRSFLKAPVQTFARTPQGARQLVVWVESLVSDPIRVVMEATGRYSHELTAWLIELRPHWAPAIVHPKLSHDFIKSLGPRNYTDRLAARCLACYGVERRPAAYELPQPEYAQLRELVRFRRQLVNDQTVQKNQAAETVNLPFVRRMQRRRLQQVQRDIARTDAAIRAFIHEHPALQRDFDLLVSIDGIGVVVAVTLLGELGDLRRFATGRQLAAFTGLSPCITASGDTVCSKTHLFKGGNRQVRHVLYLGAMAAIRANNDFQRFYLRLLERHPDTPMIPIAAVMRKLLLVARAVLVQQTPFEPNRAACGKPLTLPCQTTPNTT